MIKSFRDGLTENIWQRQRTKGFPSDLDKVARRKLGLLEDAVELKDLRIPPGNCLAALKGKRSGQYSLRINDRWRREQLPSGVRQDQSAPCRFLTGGPTMIACFGASSPAALTVHQPSVGVACANWTSRPSISLPGFSHSPADLQKLAFHKQLCV